MQILIVVLHGEPRLENYFNRIISHTADLPDPAQVEFQYDGRGFEDGMKVQANSLWKHSLWKHSVYSKGRHNTCFHQSQENSTQVLSLLTQQLSVTIRAIQFEAIKGVNRNWTGRSVVN